MSIPKNYDLGMLSSSFVPPKNDNIVNGHREKRLIKEAVKRLKGYQRREYIAHISYEYFNRNARRTEREMGWGRECVQKGLKEKETGIRCIDNDRASGRRRTEDQPFNLSEDIKSLAERQTQAAPSMR